mmetsp:Transcript_3276/g.6456  ORF Transcript_3276/g.6456 Transcript_3276/m.6456 type:complete len:254 (-) Transcript_3276:54-815(-)
MAAENGDLGKADLNGEAKETQIRSVNVQLMTQQAELERAYNDQTNIMLYLHQTEIAELKDKHAEQLRKRDDHIGSLESQLENELLLQTVEVDGLTGSLEHDVELLKREVAQLRHALKKQKFLLETSGNRDMVRADATNRSRSAGSISGLRHNKHSAASQDSEWSSDDNEFDNFGFESPPVPRRKASSRPPVARSSSFDVHGLDAVPESEAMSMGDTGTVREFPEKHMNPKDTITHESNLQHHRVMASRSCIIS